MRYLARNRFILACTLGYAFFAALWIYFSDRLLVAVADPGQMAWLSMAKGFVFIAVTSALLFMALQGVPAEEGTAPPPDGAVRTGPFRLLLALAIPFAAFILQWLFWEAITPYVWFLFYPAVFISSWIGGLAGGLLATVLSAALVWYFFIPAPQSFLLERPMSLFSIGVFMSMGLLFSFTHERLREAERRAAEARFRSLVEQSLVGIYILQDGRFRYVNPGFAEMFGYGSPGEIVDRVPVLDLVAAEDRERVAANVRRPMEGEGTGMRYGFTGLRRDGTSIQVEVHGRTLEHQGRPAVIGVVVDVTERVRAEAALRQRESLLSRMGRLAQVGGWEFDPATGKGAWTEEVARIHDLEPGAECNVAMGLSFFPGESRAAIEQAVKAAVEEGRPYDLELEFVSARGVHKWIRTVGQPVAEDGRVIRVQGAFQDITARKQAELEIRRLNADLEQRVAERTAQLAAANKELESFTYSVSHDLKAPLRGIDGYSRLLQEECQAGLNEECRLFVRNVRQGTEQMSALIEDLLAYSRMERRSLQSREVDLPGLVQALLAERDEAIRRLGAEVRVDLPPLKVRADMDGLAMVLRNLLENALKFHRPDGAPHVEIGARQEEQAVTLWVGDDGIGFDMKFHERIFEIFQRLQRAEDYPGTGVGLALVKKAMERMGGRVWAESAPGQGATFYLEIPQ
jgi:PAS domain S-box-containing protein